MAAQFFVVKLLEFNFVLKCHWKYVRKKCNTKGIEIVEQELREANYPIARLLKVDCSSEKAVEDKLLTPVLEVISQNIDGIDEIYLNQAAEFMQTLYKEYASICEQISATRTQELLEDFQKHYRLRIKDTIEGNVQNQIRNKFNEYYENVNQEYKPMNEKLEEVLHELSGTIPSKEEITRYVTRNNRQWDTYVHATDVMRPRIIDTFLELDEALLAGTKTVKDDIVQILTSVDGGGLDAVVPYKQGDDPDEWIEKFIQINHDTKWFQPLKEALMALREFKVSVEGFMLYEIRLTLTPIDSSLYDRPEKKLPLYDPKNVGKIAEVINEYLQPLLYTLVFLLKWAEQTKTRKPGLLGSILGMADTMASRFLKIPGAKDFADRSEFLRSKLKKEGDGYEIICDPLKFKGV